MVAASPSAAATISGGVEYRSGDPIGDYMVKRVIGRGAMGTVYAAVHPVIERRVAIKVLRRDLSERTDTVMRFVQEARAVNRVRHPGIVDVFGYGMTDDGACFLVMELLDGETLGDQLARGRLSIAQACSVLIEISNALEAAHAAGVVHRDLKPDNVFMVGGHHVKLLDFGIAKLTAPTASAPLEYTLPGQAIGTPTYMAPEQARGGAIDGRTDVYALGALAFELLCGQPPFVGDSGVEVMARHLTSEPPRPSDIAPALSPLADKLLLAMLAKDPADRPALPHVRAQLARLPHARPRLPRWYLPLGAAMLVLVTAMIAWSLVHDAPASSAPPPPALSAPRALLQPQPAPPPPAPPATLIAPVVDEAAPPAPPPRKRSKTKRRRAAAPPAMTAATPAPPSAPEPPTIVPEPPPPAAVEDRDALKKPTFEKAAP